MFANKSFWPWKFREGLPALGTARREAEFVRAEVVFSSSDLFLSAFDCFGLLFPGKVAVTPVGLLGKGLAGELDSSPGSAACSF